ncbi:MAG: T9SS type A sorting domain-containing protein [Bacteroidetes bacterium]|nr:T9SS type A sorting domain-containing protein [Bacteroidota bacterium]
MKQIQKFLFVALLLCLHAQLMAQYITLKGKQFYDQSGQPFYPVVCNYIVELAYDPTSSTSSTSVDYYVLQPYISYGLENHGYNDISGVTLQDGPERIKADFIKLRNMGFNTVLVMGLDFHKLNTGSFTHGGGGGYFKTRIWATVDFGNHIDIIPNYSSSTGTFATQILPKFHQLLDIAQDAGVNLMFLCGRDWLSNTMYNAADYEEYLLNLANELKDRPELLAYILDHESSYFKDGDAGSAGCGYCDGCTPCPAPLRTGVKKEICGYFGNWHDAIKAVDSHHLVTTSSTDIVSAIMDYDPGILKLDFNTYHIYPDAYWKLYEGYDIDKALQRMKNQLYWLHKNSPIPWMITETGVPANIEHNNTHFTCTQSPHNTEDISVRPWVWGDYDDQITFALESQQAVIDCEGSGYAWWQFQNTDWPQCAAGAGTYWHRNFGLLEFGSPTASGGGYTYGGPTTTTYEKPLVAAAFRGHIFTKAPATEPSNYYNPFDGVNGTNYTVTGTLSDDNGPVKNGVLTAGNAAPRTIPGIDDYYIQDDAKFDIFTFTHENGNFELVSPIVHQFDLATSTIDLSKFTGIRYSAPGANQIWAGLNPLNFPTLTRQENVFDNDGADIPSPIDNSSSPPFTARHTLTVEDVVIENGGVADFHASVEVDLKPGFESQLGSETVAYIAGVDFDCDKLEYSDHAAYKTEERKLLATDLPENKTIQVSYRLALSSIHVVPNPASDIIFIQTDVPSESFVEITNYTGSLVYANKLFIDKSSPVSIAQFASGCYFVKVNTPEKTETFKLIINKY